MKTDTLSIILSSSHPNNGLSSLIDVVYFASQVADQALVGNSPDQVYIFIDMPLVGSRS